ncbi:MAG TPA: helix-turn-helix domain-containing protein [Blastocatellia bacterium]|jgi:transcriptional regulator with XRE-family HTH domain
MGNRVRSEQQTPLAIFVKERLAELGLKQSDFCRLTGFDQGLLSKIQNSVIANLSLESSLRLAMGLGVSPRDILNLTERLDLHRLVVRSYITELFPDQFQLDGNEMPPPVLEVSRLALYLHLLGLSLTPVTCLLSQLSLTPRKTNDVMLSDMTASPGQVSSTGTSARHAGILSAGTKG